MQLAVLTVAAGAVLAGMLSIVACSHGHARWQVVRTLFLLSGLFAGVVASALAARWLGWGVGPGLQFQQGASPAAALLLLAACAACIGGALRVVRGLLVPTREDEQGH